MKKIPKKYAPFLGGLMMSVMMAFFMSGIVTFLNVGFSDNFVEIWMSAFITVTPIAFCVVLVVKPLVEKIIRRITV